VTRALDAILGLFDRITPQARRRGALVALLASLVGWPVSALTFAHGEPPAILGLSWLAVSITAVDVLLTTDVRKEVDDEA
jgi:hypothetical protein